MSNKLPAEVQERINADADKLYPLFLQADTKAGYIAGATAENAHFQPILDALDQFISFHESGLLPAKHVYEKAVAVRKQWKEGKDKEAVKDPCPSCGKELSRDRHGCCRECGAYELTNPPK